MNKANSFTYKKNRLQQVKGFYYTARLNSVSEAANKINLTQSTVTIQIQSLERDLGYKLFKREGRKLSLTEDGKKFYEIACPAFQQLEFIVDDFLEKKSEEDKKEINIAMHHITINYLMPKIIKHFKENNPDTKIIIRNISPTDAIERLKNSDIDLALYPNQEKDPAINYEDLTSYKPILIMNKNHPLVDKKIESIKDLRGFDLIRIDKSLITLPIFEESIKSFNIKSSVEFENGNWEILKRFVKDNNFIAVVSEICISKDDQLVTKDLSKLFPKMKYSIMQKSGAIPTEKTKKLIESINFCIENS